MQCTLCFQGTSAEQDNRFADKQKKLLKSLKFDESLHTKVDMQKVQLDSLKPWISERITGFLGLDDELVVDFVSNQLEDTRVSFQNRKRLHPSSFEPAGRLRALRKHHFPSGIEITLAFSLNSRGSYLASNFEKRALTRGFIRRSQFPDPRLMQINLTGFLNGRDARIFMGELWSRLASAQNSKGGVPPELLEKKKEEIRKLLVSVFHRCRPLSAQEAEADKAFLRAYGHGRSARSDSRVHIYNFTRA